MTNISRCVHSIQLILILGYFTYDGKLEEYIILKFLALIPFSFFIRLPDPHIYYKNIKIYINYEK